MTAEQMRTFQSRWPVRKACPLDASVELTLVYSTAAGEAMALLKDWILGANPGTARTLSIYVPDKNVGSDHYSGEFVIDGDVEIPLEAGNASPVAVTLPLSITGALSQTTATT